MAGSRAATCSTRPRASCAKRGQAGFGLINQGGDGAGGGAGGRPAPGRDSRSSARFPTSATSSPPRRVRRAQPRRGHAVLGDRGAVQRQARRRQRPAGTPLRRRSPRALQIVPRERPAAGRGDRPLPGHAARRPRGAESGPPAGGSPRTSTSTRPTRKLDRLLRGDLRRSAGGSGPVSRGGSSVWRPGSRMRRFAEAVSWLWRLGPVSEGPRRGRSRSAGTTRLESARPDAVNAARWRRRRSSPTGPGRIGGRVPSRARRDRRRRVRTGWRSRGSSSASRREAAVSSSLGVHATREEQDDGLRRRPGGQLGCSRRLLGVAGAGRPSSRDLGRRLAALPPIGLVRYDDIPGTAYHQKIGRPRRPTARRCAGPGR